MPDAFQDCKRFQGYYTRRCKEQPDEPHWKSGLDMCNKWADFLADEGKVEQEEIDDFIRRMENEKQPGTGWIELDMLFKHWARKAGFKVN